MNKKFEGRQFSDIKFEKDAVQPVANSNDIMIEGWATKEGFNLAGVNVLVSSYLWDGAFEDFSNGVLAYHMDIFDGVGKVEKYWVVDTEEDKGLKVRVRLYGDNNPLFIRGIKEGTVDSFSIGYDILEWDKGEEKDTFVFTKIKIYEVSTVHIGKNNEAHFAIKDSLRGINNKPNKTFKEPKLMGKELELNAEDKNELENMQPVLDELSSGQKTLKENEVTFNKLIGEIQKNVKDLQDGKLSESMFKSVMDKIRPDFDKVSEEIQSIKAIAQAKSERFDMGIQDFRGLIKGYSFYKDGGGDLAQRAYMLFNLPVDYKSMGMEGSRLIALRNLHDTVYMLSEQSKYTHKEADFNASDIRQDYIEEVRHWDPVLADAMAIGNTSYGAEWNPTEFSSEVQEWTRAQSGFVSRFRKFSNIDKLPYIAGVGKCHKGGEPLVVNADRVQTTKTKTGNVTVNYAEFVAAIVISELFNERSIVPVMAHIREEIGQILVDGRAQAFINSDRDGTHIDTGKGYVSADIETAVNGLRRYCSAGSFNRDADTAATVDLEDCRDTITLLGRKGLKQSECFILTGIAGKSQLMGVYDLAATYGALGSIFTGQLPPIYGLDTFIDGEYPQDLTALGIYDGATTTYSSMLFVHAPSWGFFEERPITLEFNKDIMTQQLQFVGTARWALEQIRGDDTTTGHTAYSAYALVKWNDS